MTDLEFIQSLSEEEFSEWVLIPLLEAMEYTDIRYTHGYLERGKDIVFCREDLLQGLQHFCATVKRFALTGSVTGSRSIREVVFQIRQALSSPFVNPTNATCTDIEKVFVVTPFQINQIAIQSISDELKQYEHRVTFIDGPKLMSLIRKYLPSLLQSLPNPESRYIYLLCQRFLDSTILTRLGSTRAVTLMDIYTGGQLSPTTKEEAKYITFALTPTKSQHSVPIHLSDVLNKHPYCIVLADVGSGKTTLLQKYTLDIGGFPRSKSVSNKNTVPIFLSLAKISVNALWDYKSFCDFIVNQLRTRDKYDGFNIGSVENCVLLLDGFDELQEQHDKVLNYITQLASVFPKIVLTSRPSRTPDLPAPFSYYRLLPFGDDNIKEFLSKWFPENPSIQKAIFNRIDDNPSLLQFCRTPLILTLYSLLAGNIDTMDRLPVRRTAIYEQIVEMLLGKWDQIRRVHNEFSPDLKQHVLEMAAIDTHARRRRSFTQQTLESIVLDVSESMYPQRLINEIVFRSSLIRRQPNGEFEFVHLSFQEFLTAKRLSKNTGEYNPSKYLLDEWWKGTLVFYFGICRTLDGIRIPRRVRKGRGAGLRFIEFMAEANFTGQEKRSEIISLLVRDLLGSTELTQSDLKICQRVGDVLVDIIEKIVSDHEFDGNLSNYFVIMRSIGTHKAIKSHWRHSEYLGRLSVTALLENLRDAIPLITGETEVTFVTKGFITLAHSLDSIYWENPSTLIHFCRILKDLPSVVTRFRTKKLVNQKLLSKLLDAWFQVQLAFTSSIHTEKTLYLLDNDSLRLLAEAVSLLDREVSAAKVVLYCLYRLRELLPSKIQKTSKDQYDPVLNEIETKISEVLRLIDRKPADMMVELQAIVANKHLWS